MNSVFWYTVYAGHILYDSSQMIKHWKFETLLGEYLAAKHDANYARTMYILSRYIDLSQ